MAESFVGVLFVGACALMFGLASRGFSDGWESKRERNRKKYEQDSPSGS